MKCISLWQPWASLVVLGKKRCETRSWRTSHCGPLAIHASKKWSKELARLSIGSPFGEILRGRILPRGAIVGVVNLESCHTIDRTNVPQSPESEFGDYTFGRYRWDLSHAKQLAVPIPFRGRQGLFEIPDELLTEESNGRPA